MDHDLHVPINKSIKLKAFSITTSVLYLRLICNHKLGSRGRLAECFWATDSFYPAVMENGARGAGSTIPPGSALILMPNFLASTRYTMA